MLDLNHWQTTLQNEKSELEGQLGQIGRRNPQNKSDWEVKPLEEPETSFRDEVASELEEMDKREEVELSLEHRLREVNQALERLKQGRYGICEIGGEPIETKRLRINPAARTCKVHLNQEKNLG